MVDSQVVLNLRYAALMPKFLEMRRAELETLESAIASSDWDKVTRIGHNLRGTGTSFGLDVISELGTQIEAAAKQGDADTLPGLYQHLSEFLANVNPSYRNSILFVDDQPEILTLLRRLFADDEYICHFANSAEQALEVLNEQPVDVIVSDLVMPEVGGLQLLRIVRDQFPNVVRIVLSGQAQVPSILAAINSGQVFRYLTKPWRVDADARAVIAEAVAHANEINAHETHDLRMSVTTLCEMLDAAEGRYLITGRDDRVVAVSADFSEMWPIGHRADTQKISMEAGQTIAIDRHHIAWIWPR